MIPLDVTTSFVYTPAETQAIIWQVNHSAKAEFMTQLTDFVISTNRKFRETHYKNGFFVHDAHTVGFLAYPHLYKWSFVDLSVETIGEHTKWQTIVDRRNHARTGVSKVLFMTDVDKDGLLEALTEDMKEFDFE
jgi:inosine-uridine nucleoside N-ribohydrolase